MIIADDVTGASDTGVQLARRGISTVVSFSPARAARGGGYVLETDSRALEGRAAYRRLRGLCDEIDFGGFQYVIKKVDSTLRGNIPWEIRAVDESFGGEMVLFMPALPDMGRTTVDAVHLLDGRRITATELARDPRSPVLEDHLIKILAGVYSEKITHFPVRDIEAGRLDFSSGRLFVSDAVTNRHMQTVIRAALKTGKRTLWVGAAAIADNLLETEYPMLPAMGLAASVSEATRRQVRYAEKNGVPLVIVPAGELMGGGDKRRFVHEAVAHLKEKKDVIVLTGAVYDRAELNRGGPMNPDSRTAGEEIQKIMGKIAADILKQAEVSGVFLTGGDTARAFFSEIGAASFRVLSEALTAIPLMRVEGGPFHGMKVVTKAGAFGKEDGLLYSLRKLREKG